MRKLFEGILKHCDAAGTHPFAQSAKERGTLSRIHRAGRKPGAARLLPAMCGERRASTHGSRYVTNSNHLNPDRK